MKTKGTQTRNKFKIRYIPLSILLMLFAFLFFFGVFFYIVGFSFTLDRQGINSLIQSKVIEAKNCEIHSERVTFFLSLRKFSIQDLQGECRPNNDVNYKFQISSIQGDIVSHHLLTGIISLRKIVFEQPKVTVTEKHQTSLQVSGSLPSKKNVSSKKAVPRFIFEDLNVKDGEFNYRSERETGLAELPLRDISASLNLIKLTQKIEDYHSNLNIEGVIGKNGRFAIQATFQPATDKNQDSISVRVKTLDLSEVNQFFEHETRFLLNGRLNGIYASFDVSQGSVAGTLDYSVQDLEIDFLNDSKKSFIDTFITDTAADIFLNPSSGKPISNNTRFSATRKPDQSVFNFLLAGLKPALVKSLFNSKNYGRY